MNPITTIIACVINLVLTLAALELWQCGKKALAISMVIPAVCVCFTLGILGAAMMS
jgi:hypothetical protein